MSRSAFLIAIGVVDIAFAVTGHFKAEGVGSLMGFCFGAYMLLDGLGMLLKGEEK